MSSIQCGTRLDGDALKHTALSPTVQGASIAQPADLQAVMMAGGALVFYVCVARLNIFGETQEGSHKVQCDPPFRWSTVGQYQVSYTDLCLIGGFLNDSHSGNLWLVYPWGS